MPLNRVRFITVKLTLGLRLIQYKYTRPVNSFKGSFTHTQRPRSKIRVPFGCLCVRAPESILRERILNKYALFVLKLLIQGTILDLAAYNASSQAYSSETGTDYSSETGTDLGGPFDPARRPVFSLCAVNTGYAPADCSSTSTGCSCALAAKAFAAAAALDWPLWYE